MTVRNDVIHWLNNMVRGRMKGWQHVAEFVEVRQIFQRWPTAFVVDVSQIGRTRHWYKHHVVIAKGQIVRWIACVVSKALRNGSDELTHQIAV